MKTTIGFKNLNDAVLPTTLGSKHYGFMICKISEKLVGYNNIQRKHFKFQQIEYVKIDLNNPKFMVVFLVVVDRKVSQMFYMIDLTTDSLPESIGVLINDASYDSLNIRSSLRTRDLFKVLYDSLTANG